jgi:hypothetical protein
MENVINSEEYNKESTVFKNYLNNVIGIVAFTFALTCLSFDNSQVMAWLTSPIVFSLFLFAPKLKSITNARNIIDNSASKEDKKLLNSNFKEVVNKEPIYKFLIRSIPYIYGTTFYTLVLLIPEFSIWLKNL